MTLLNTTPRNTQLGWWFQIFCIFHPENWGNDPIELIFFKWVETTNLTDIQDIRGHPSRDLPSEVRGQWDRKVSWGDKYTFLKHPEIYHGYPWFVNGISFPTCPQIWVSKFWRGWVESEEKLQLCNPRSSQNHPQSPDIVCSMACCLRKKRSHKGRVKLVLLPVRVSVVCFAKVLPGFVVCGGNQKKEVKKKRRKQHLHVVEVPCRCFCGLMFFVEPSRECACKEC